MIKLKDLLEDNQRHDVLTEFFGFGGSKSKEPEDSSKALPFPDEASGEMTKSETLPMWQKILDPTHAENIRRTGWYKDGHDHLLPYIKKLDVDGTYPEDPAKLEKWKNDVNFLKLTGKHLATTKLRFQYDAKGKPLSETPSPQGLQDFKYESKWRGLSDPIDKPHIAGQLQTAIIKYLEVLRKRRDGQWLVGRYILNKLANISDGERYKLATAGDR